MKNSTGANRLTDSLISVVRLQRHLACRIIIATQEPTISPQLLDLCSITLVHRFTSPAWLQTLRRHLAAASADTATGDASGLFSQIAGLDVGEALLFAPSAMLHAEMTTDPGATSSWRIHKMGVTYLRVRIRNRLTADGGKSICTT